jgi:hypothetical protein
MPRHWDGVAWVTVYPALVNSVVSGAVVSPFCNSTSTGPVVDAFANGVETAALTAVIATAPVTAAAGTIKPPDASDGTIAIAAHRRSRRALVSLLRKLPDRRGKRRHEACEMTDP